MYSPTREEAEVGEKRKENQRGLKKKNEKKKIEKHRNRTANVTTYQLHHLSTKLRSNVTATCSHLVSSRLAVKKQRNESLSQGSKQEKMRPKEIVNLLCCRYTMGCSICVFNVHLRNIREIHIERKRSRTMKPVLECVANVSPHTTRVTLENFKIHSCIQSENESVD